MEEARYMLSAGLRHLADWTSLAVPLNVLPNAGPPIVVADIVRGFLLFCGPKCPRTSCAWAMITSVRRRLFTTADGMHSTDAPARLRVYNRPSKISKDLWWPMFSSTFEHSGSSAYPARMSFRMEQSPSMQGRMSGRCPKESPIVGSA